MTVKKSVKRLREDIHKFIEDKDVEGAMNALREGLQATSVVRKSRSDGQRGVEYTEKADHTTRLHSARLLLEYGFGKPATRHDISINDETQKAASPAEIMARLRNSGAQLTEILDVYTESVKEAEIVPNLELETNNLKET
tara:strand:- start:1079 stop:1498 length:420 start_codon:yes stop_codon:yes gene_type:complete